MSARRFTELEKAVENLEKRLAEEKERGDRLEAKLAAMLLLETNGGNGKAGRDKTAALVDVGLDALANTAPGFTQSEGSAGYAIISAVAAMIQTSNADFANTMFGINVQGQDPDRFAHDLASAFNQHVHPTPHGPSGPPTKLKGK